MTCSSCGESGNPSGTTVCTSCGQPMPADHTPANEAKPKEEGRWTVFEKGSDGAWRFVLHRAMSAEDARERLETSPALRHYRATPTPPHLRLALTSSSEPGRDNNRRQFRIYRWYEATWDPEANRWHLNGDVQDRPVNDILEVTILE